MSLKVTGLGLASGQVSQQAFVYSGQYLGQQLVACSDEDWTRLEGALGGLGGLEAIDLSENWALGTSGAARLVGGLGRGVKSLSLKETGLGLASGQVSQQALVFGGQYQGQQLVACSDEDWTRLEGALGGLGGLETIDELSVRDRAGLQMLDLSCNQLGPVGAERVMAALKQLTGLQDLNLSGNILGPVGGEHVLAALRGLTRLQVLNLGNNGFDASMCYAVASTVGILPNVQSLELE